MIVAPIGVLPMNAVDHRAVIRPRMSGRAASWTVLFPVVRNVMLAKPTTASSATAATVWVVRAVANIAAAYTSAARIILGTPVFGWRVQ
jgi:hypothetical protein